jgi:hypothetical protein
VTENQAIMRDWGGVVNLKGADGRAFRARGACSLGKASPRFDPGALAGF